jgi:hypothetical protein
MLSFANRSSVAVLFLTIPITVLDWSLANALIKAYCVGGGVNNLDRGVPTPVESAFEKVWKDNINSPQDHEKLL